MTKKFFPKKSKFLNKKITIDGITFDSRKEAARWRDLRLMEKAGEICCLTRQARFPLTVNGEKIATYICDFDYVKDGVRVIEDCKSPITKKISTYRMKRKLLKAIYGIDITET